MYRPVATSATFRGGMATDSGDDVVTLDQIPRWGDAEYKSSLDHDMDDPLMTQSGTEGGGIGSMSKFPVDHEVNSKIYLWRGDPWNLEVDAVVNSTNEVCDL